MFKFDPATLRTTSFWVTAFFQLGVVLGTSIGGLPTKYAVYFSAASAVSYTVSRTITKYRADFKRGWNTTEFALALVSVAIAAVSTLQDNITSTQFASVAAVLATVYKVARALQTARLVDVA